MSVIFHEENLFFVDHKKFISYIYRNVCESDGDYQSDALGKNKSFTITGKLFSINKIPKDAYINKKRTRDCDVILKEATAVKRMYGEIVKLLPLDLKNNLKLCNILETSLVRDISKKFFETTIFDHNGLSGGNSSDVALKCKVKDDYYLVPKKSNFLCGCVKEKCKKLIGNEYDLVVVDPPWWNKYIRRLRSSNDKLGYSMMYNEDIASIPVKELLSNKCIVAVWCTNAPSNITAVKNIIFKAWGVEYVTTWYWIKVTTDLEPICEFGSGCKKQPYERIILGKVGDVMVPENCLVASIPSSLHSHKPPLIDLLSPYINRDTPKVLELFARYLLPNTTSIGFEPLKWQHISLYEET